MSIEQVVQILIGLASTLSLFLLNYVFGELKALRNKIDGTRDEYLRRDEAERQNGQVMSSLTRMERIVERIDEKLDRKQDKIK